MNHSYIEIIDASLSKIPNSIKVLFIQSDCPDILNLILDKNTGSYKLIHWLGLDSYKDNTGFPFLREMKLAQPLTSVYEEAKHFEGPRAPAQKANNEIILNGSQVGTVYFSCNNKRFSISVNQLQKEDALAAKEENWAQDLTGGKTWQGYFVGEEDTTINVQLKIAEQISGRCHFFYLRNAGAYEGPTLTRMIHTFLESEEKYPGTKLIISSSIRCIPASLADQIQLIHLGAPTYQDVYNQLEQKLGNEKENFSPEEKAKYARMLTGLTYQQLENVYATLENGLPGFLRKERFVETVWQQRQLESEKDGILAIKQIDENPGIVGNSGFTHWLNENLPDLANPEEAKKLDIQPPRGTILAGVPGTGKTQLAKQMAYQWSHFNSEKDPQPISFIEFNLGRLSSKNYGESEERMQHFLMRISEQAPAILFIDEVEKSFFKDDKSNAEMHEVKKAQMGMLLGWLQEHKENIFTFMTSNDISILPPELIRSGRLSARFFVFLPNYTELMCMLYSFLRKKAKNKIFEDNFIQEIESICGKIDTYSSEYGKSASNDEKLDNDLSKAIQKSSLYNVLIELTKYAINPNNDKARAEALEAEALEKRPIDWDSWLKDTAIHMRTPFFTGADLKELVKNTMLWLRREKGSSSGEWTSEDFSRAFLACSKEFTPYGQSNMDKLVQLYRSCDYQDVSAHPILPRSKFDPRRGTFETGETGYIMGTKPDNLYDKYLQQAMMYEIKEAAGVDFRKRKYDGIQFDLAEAQRKHLPFQEKQMEFQNAQMDRTRAQWEKEDANKKQQEEGSIN